VTDQRLEVPFKYFPAGLKSRIIQVNIFIHERSLIMSITAIGKELRKLRIDRDERLLDMAKRLRKSSAFISAVETGKKSPPSGFEELVIKAYRLAHNSAGSLRIAADRSRKAFTLEASTSLQRDTAGLMARRINGLSDNELQKILKILRQKENTQ